MKPDCDGQVSKHYRRQLMTGELTIGQEVMTRNY